MARVSGSDKLEKYNLIYRVQWILAIAQWLTLLQCHHIQLPVINLGLSLTSNTTIHQKISFWLCIFTTWVPWHASPPCIGTLTSLPDARMFATSAGSLYSAPPDSNNVTSQIFPRKTSLQTSDSMHDLILATVQHKCHHPIKWWIEVIQTVGLIYGYTLKKFQESFLIREALPCCPWRPGSEKRQSRKQE